MRRLVVGTTLVGVSIFLLFLVLGYVAPDAFILRIGEEDGAVEYLGAILWAAAAGVCVIRLLRGQRQSRLLLVLWAVATVVFMGEEISWFQRLLGFETPPEIRDANAQGEFNIHNLVGLRLGSLANAQYAFLLGFVGYFLVLPLLMAWGRAQGWAGRVGYAAPQPAFLVMIWLAIGVSYVVQAVGAEEARRVTVESRETFFAFAVFSYLYLYLRGAPRLATTAPDARRLTLPDGPTGSSGVP